MREEGEPASSLIAVIPNSSCDAARALKAVAVEDCVMVTIRHERAGDVGAREVLLDLAFGDARFAKASERLREGRRPAAGLSLVATEAGRVVGTVRLWHVAAGGRPALLLGPLAVDPVCRDRGIGAALMRRALRTALRAGYAAVLLVGDAPYYARFGFSTAKTRALRMPGAYDQHRLLAAELTAGALDGVAGDIVATGAAVRSPAPAYPAPAPQDRHLSQAA